MSPPTKHCFIVSCIKSVWSKVSADSIDFLLSEMVDILLGTSCLLHKLQYRHTCHKNHNSKFFSCLLMGSVAEDSKGLGGTMKLGNFRGIKWNRLVQDRVGWTSTRRGLRPAVDKGQDDDDYESILRCHAALCTGL